MNYFDFFCIIQACHISSQQHQYGHQNGHHNQASPSLVASAESTLNSMINSLNQIDYSHLDGFSAQTVSSSPQKFANQNPNATLNIDELRSENELMQSMIERLMEENAQLRAEKMLLTSTVSTSGPNHTLQTWVMH